MANRSPDYWDGRAEETRVIAENVRDPTAKATLFDIAEQYEDMAQRARLSLAQISGITTKRGSGDGIQG